MHDKNAWNLKINEKGRVIWSYWPWERKTLQKDQRKTTKNWLDALTDRIEREKVLKSLKSVWTCEKERFLKNSLYNFRLIENKVRSIENASTNPTPIKHRSKQIEADQNFNRNFDRSRNRFDQSKLWKKPNFEIQSNFMQKLLKALNFMYKMHEHEMKCFSKTLVLNPVFPILRFSINSPYILKHQTCFASNFKNFQTWLAKPKSHTISCTKFSKE